MIDFEQVVDGQLCWPMCEVNLRCWMKFCRLVSEVGAGQMKVWILGWVVGLAVGRIVAVVGIWGIL
jgi:hypothetical protein